MNDQKETAKAYFLFIKYFTALMAIILILWVIPKDQVTSVILIVLGVFFIFVGLPLALVQYIWASVATGSHLKETKKAGLANSEQKKIWNITLIFLVITHVLGLIVATMMILGFANLKLPAGIEIMAVVLIAGVLMIPNQCVSMRYLTKLESRQAQ